MEINLPRSVKSIIKGFFISVLLLMISTIGFACNAAINSTIEPGNPVVKLDITFINNGFLKYMDSIRPVINPAPFILHHLVEMVFYNTPNSENVTKGLFSNDGIKYIVLQDGLYPDVVQNWKWTT